MFGYKTFHLAHWSSIGTIILSHCYHLFPNIAFGDHICWGVVPNDVRKTYIICPSFCKNQLTGKWLVMYIPPGVYPQMCCIQRLLLIDPFFPPTTEERERESCRKKGELWWNNQIVWSVCPVPMRAPLEGIKLQVISKGFHLLFRIIHCGSVELAAFFFPFSFFPFYIYIISFLP